MTTHQHYIPRMLLKRWRYWETPMSNPFVIRKGKKKRIDRVWVTNIPTKISELKNTTEICYGDFLYEYCKNKTIIDKNIIENRFSILENKWSVIIDKIEKEKTSKITPEDIAFLKILVIIQILRTPNTISFMTNTVNGFVPKELSKEEADRYYKIFALRLGINIEAQQIFWSFFEYYANSQKIVIFYSKQDIVLSAENPVLLIQGESQAVPLVYLPISPHYIIGLLPDYGFDDKNHTESNTKMEVSKIDTNLAMWINNKIIENSYNIISIQPLEKEWFILQKGGK